MVDRFESYLGLSTPVGKVKYQTFSYRRIEFGKNYKGGRA